MENPLENAIRSFAQTRARGTGNLAQLQVH